MLRDPIRSPVASLLSAAALGLAASASAQPGPGAESAPGYRTPPELVREIFERHREPLQLSHASPDHRRFLLPLSSPLSSLAEMARPTLRLAMLELRPDAGREWRLDTFGIHGYRIVSLPGSGGADSLWLLTPEGRLVSDAVWSPDGARIALLVHEPDASRVWIADAATGAAAPLSPEPVLATLAAVERSEDPAPSRVIQWSPGGGVIALLTPADRGPAPEPPRVAPGPRVRSTREAATPTRTLPFLFEDDHQRELFRYHARGQWAELLPERPARRFGEPGLYTGGRLSPDGRWLLAERIDEPLSELVGHDDFPHRLEVIPVAGGAAVTLRERPAQEALLRGEPGPAADLPRAVAWRPDAEGLFFVWREPKPAAGAAPEAGSGGSATPSRRGDRVFSLAPPFEMAAARLLLASEDELRDAALSADGRWLFAAAEGRGDDEKRTRRLLAWELAEGGPRLQLLAAAFDPEDPLALPGELVEHSDVNGVRRALLGDDGRHAWLLGEGYRADQRPRPFLDRVPLAGDAAAGRERVFEGSAELYERPLLLLDSDARRLVVQREGPARYPDSFLYERASGRWHNLTRAADPHPELTAARRVDFEFQRRDGVTVHARIALPPGAAAGERLPAIFWTYPREYATAEEYQRDALRSRAQNRHTPLTFLRWSEIWLAAGYALVSPDVPIIGPKGSFNDRYTQHLVDTLYAAIREVDRRGWVDPDRIGHGGHSYGAFATANLLARTPFFKAGIAGNGAYNRTLTPMGFQSERRFLWEARETYLEMSPFFHADHIDTPLLMYHGADDDNSGTWPMQSERLLQALTGLGKTAQLVSYPYESHTPRAVETYYDLWARWLDWFARYVRGGER